MKVGQFCFHGSIGNNTSTSSSSSFQLNNARCWIQASPTEHHNDRSGAACIQRILATFTSTSVHFLSDLSTLRLPLTFRRTKSLKQQISTFSGLLAPYIERLIKQYYVLTYITIDGTSVDTRLILNYNFVLYDLDENLRLNFSISQLQRLPLISS